ncbi:MAG: hypothetical protein HOV80_06955 [Polyangiaceae bacterium]|nr:hypothetical protein [Polyangiaceae bacterium]
MTRLDDALEEALAGGRTVALFSELERVSGMPGPRPNLLLLKSLGARIARAGATGRELSEVLVSQKSLPLYTTGVFAIGADAANKATRQRGLGKLHDLSDEPVKERRTMVVEALADLVAAHGDEIAVAMKRFTDGFLHAVVALEALTEQRALARLSSPDALLERFAEAFDLADDAPRAADRAQGVRILRESMPAQIARAVVRFGELAAFVEERATRERPETREVVAQTIAALRKVLGEADADRLRKTHGESAKPPRDPSRIVQGTRKRSRGRR